MKKEELDTLFSRSAASPVWEAFRSISSIPRCSTNEKAIMGWIMGMAGQRGFKVQSDNAGNLLVIIPGKTGGRPRILLQSHTDMVCEQNEGNGHDFCRDGLDLDSDGTWVFARGTTLGADNGIGVAMMMALMDCWKGQGDLGLLFTVDEERGLTGAKNLDPAFLDAGVLLNLDGEEEGTFYIGCAGGQETAAMAPLELEKSASGSAAYELKVRGLKGGHSGADIHLQRGNAIKILARILDSLLHGQSTGPGTGIAAINGGDKHNAIPREASALFLARPANAEHISSEVKKLESEILGEFSGQEPEFNVTFLPVQADHLEGSPMVWTPGFAGRAVSLLCALPHGVDAMSRELPGLVSASSNLASVRTQEGNLRIITSQRGDRDSLMFNLGNKIAACFSLAGFAVESQEPYPAWPPAPDTRLVKSIARAWENTRGSPAVITSIHAGLECGVIGKKHPGLPMVSFGPTITGAHTPEERAETASVERIWLFLKDFLHAWDREASGS